jgi:hypothetical protein
MSPFQVPSHMGAPDGDDSDGDEPDIGLQTALQLSMQELAVESATESRREAGAPVSPHASADPAAAAAQRPEAGASASSAEAQANGDVDCLEALAARGYGARAGSGRKDAASERGVSSNSKERSGTCKERGVSFSRGRENGEQRHSRRAIAASALGAEPAAAAAPATAEDAADLAADEEACLQAAIAASLEGVGAAAAPPNGESGGRSADTDSQTRA